MLKKQDLDYKKIHVYENHLILSCFKHSLIAYKISDLIKEDFYNIKSIICTDNYSWSTEIKGNYFEDSYFGEDITLMNLNKDSKQDCENYEVLNKIQYICG